MGAHSRFAPSAQQRNYDCPASLLLNEAEPDHPSIDAAHGTAAHHLGELCLKTKARTEKYAGCVIGVTLAGETYFVHEHHPAPEEGEGWAFEVDDEMIACVQDYVDWCNELPGEHFVEVRVGTSHLCPERDENGDPLEPQSGTSDHIAIDGRVAYVTDLKYGKGVQVFAQDNLQGVSYTSGAIRMFDIFDEVEEIHIRICQPRLNHRDVWVLTRAELREWEAKIKAANERALQPNPPFGPTEKACRFCKIAARCRALRDHLDSKSAFAFDDLTENWVEPDVRFLTDEEIVEGWKASAMMKHRITAIAAEMIRVMAQGAELPGVFLAETKTHRQFANKRAVEAFLRLDCDLPRSKVYTEKMISPNAAMKIVPKEFREELASMVIKPPGGPCIVEAGSKQPRFKGVVPADFFDNLDAGEQESE